MSPLILLVEDEPDTRRIYTDELLARGYNVLTAVQGAEGVHLARRSLPDLILLDLRMPVMDGHDAIEYLKSDEATENIPVWVISAYLDDTDLPDPVIALADRVLEKPAAPAELMAMIESHFARLHPTAA